MPMRFISPPLVKQKVTLIFHTDEFPLDKTLMLYFAFAYTVFLLQMLVIPFKFSHTNRFAGCVF